MLNSDNVHTLFDDIDNLLKDLCEFLSENIKDGSISERHKNLAKQLVERSKKQLQNISVVTATLSRPEADEDESYVDMTPTKGPPVEEPPPMVQLRHPPIIKDPITRECPYISHRIHEIKDIEKAGYLEKKVKLWSFLDHQVKQFIVIKDSWLMIYSSENDKKPREVVDLKKSLVKHVDHFKDGASQRDMKMFELITETTTFQFLGKNAKDMEQWISIISKSSKYEDSENGIEERSNPNPPAKLVGKISQKELPPEPVPGVQNKYTRRWPESSPRISEPSDTYDPVNITDGPTDEEYTQENIYESPRELITTANKKTKLKTPLTQDTPPPLPPFIFRKDKSPQPKPKLLPPQIEPNIHPPIPPTILRDKPKPFVPPTESTVAQQLALSEDEDVEYDEPLNEKEDIEPPKLPNVDKQGYIKKPLPMVIQPSQDDEDETYDEVIHPPTPPEILRDKPKPFGAPKETTITRQSSFSEDEDVEYDVPLNVKEDIKPPKEPIVDRQGYVKKPLVMVIQPSQDDDDETYDEIIHPEVDVKKPVPKVAGFKPNTLPKMAVVLPPRAPKPALPIRRPSGTKRTVF